MIKLIDLHAIIKLKEGGRSNRVVAQQLGINKDTVAKYWNSYTQKLIQLDDSLDIREIQEAICTKPKYDSSNRIKRKYTNQIDNRIDQILSNEKSKLIELGWDKQKLTASQIHEILVDEGFDVGLTTISTQIRSKREKINECFIRQHYEYGGRLEFDFGEVKLLINSVKKRFYMAVLSSPKSDFRWAYLYPSQTKDVFLDAHNKFFEMVGGVYKEVVYDNMRNVVKKFVGKHEKLLNDDLLKLSLYYGFDINVTNCFKGNEKGHVEGSVRIIRNKVFSKRYKFSTYESAEKYLQESLIKLNSKSDITKEKEFLKPTKPVLNLAKINKVKVNKYSLITVENNYYSVPEYLVGAHVVVKVYYDSIKVYSNDTFVTEHKKVDGLKLFNIEIMHYLNTFLKKPGALKNSHALKSNPHLKSIYDTHYKTRPIEFIELLQNNQHLNITELENKIKEINKSYIDKHFSKEHEVSDLINVTRNQIKNYNNLIS